MIKYNPKNWISLIFHAYSREIMKRLFPAMLLIGAYAALINVALEYFNIEFSSTTAVHSILGIVLGFFLVFRTNTAYDRWWEGRKAWGMLVNNSRNIALYFSAMIPKEHEMFHSLKTCIKWYPATLKEHLRNSLSEDDQKRIKEDLGIDFTTHYPNAVAKRIIAEINALKKEGVIDAEQYRVVDDEISALTDITGICERIKNTPIPYSYLMFMKKFIFVFMATLPFAFVDHFGFWTVGIVVLILYILLSIELLAEEIEDPFGKDVNDLPTDELASKIAANVDEIMS